MLNVFKRSEAAAQGLTSASGMASVPAPMDPPDSGLYSPAGEGSGDAELDAIEGTLISGPGGDFSLVEADRLHFAVLRPGVGQYLLLVAEAAWGKPQMFEVRRRVRSELHADSMERQVKAATIAKLYARFQPGAKSGQINSASATAPEKLVRQLAEQAVEAGASDIHIETRGGHAEVLFRVNGSRRHVTTLTHEDATSVGRVMYTVYAESGNKEEAWNPNTVQDAAVEYILSDGAHVQLRFSSGPIYPHPNFQIVLRVLRMNVSSALSIDQMGFSDAQRNMIETMVSGSRGMVLLVGPTNSGKSTTMQALLRRVFERRGATIKLITVEDPVEYVIPNAVQVGVPRKRKSLEGAADGKTFAKVLGGALRQDPDVLMVGEMRDLESAGLARDAVLAGRKLFTTLHAYSAMGTYIRLREIGVDWDVLTSPGFITGVVYQRLLQVLCSHCKVPLSQGEHLLPRDTVDRMRTVLGGRTEGVYVRGSGCPHCDGAGHTSRTVCAELLVPDTKFLKLIAANDFLGAEMHRRRGQIALGHPPTVLAHAVDKMRQGLIDPHDLEEHIEPLSLEALTVVPIGDEGDRPVAAVAPVTPRAPVAA